MNILFFQKKPIIVPINNHFYTFDYQILLKLVSPDIISTYYSWLSLPELIFLKIVLYVKNNNLRPKTN